MPESSVFYLLFPSASVNVIIRMRRKLRFLFQSVYILDTLLISIDTLVDFCRNPLSSYSKYACYSIDGRHASSNLVEIDPSTLQFRERLGSGEFGEVLCLKSVKLPSSKPLTK